jgi:hypothetical protein
MKTVRMHRLMVALCAAAGLGVAGAAVAATPLTKDQYAHEKDRIKAEYDSAIASCKPMNGNTKDICEVTAKGNRDAALADAEAAYKDTPKARYNARVAHAEAAYKVAKEKCDDLSGNPKDVCVKQAKAAEVKAKADAKVDRVATDANKDATTKVADAKKDAAEDKRDAQYKVAIEKCDALAGDAKERCVTDAKRAFGRS